MFVDSDQAVPRVAYALVDLDGQVGIVVDVPPEVLYRLVLLVVYLADCLYAECMYFLYVLLLFLCSRWR